MVTFFVLFRCMTPRRLFRCLTPWRLLTAGQGSTILRPCEKQLAELRKHYGSKPEPLLVEDNVAASYDAITTREADWIFKFAPDEFRGRIVGTLRNLSSHDQGGAGGNSLRAEALSADAGRDRGFATGREGLIKDNGRGIRGCGANCYSITTLGTVTLRNANRCLPALSFPLHNPRRYTGELSCRLSMPFVPRKIAMRRSHPRPICSSLQKCTHRPWEGP